MRSKKELNFHWHSPWCGNWVKGDYIGRRRDFVITQFDLGGRDMNVDTTRIRSVNLHNLEPLRPATDDDGCDNATAAITTTTGDTTITDPVSIRVFEAPSPYPFNYK